MDEDQIAIAHLVQLPLVFHERGDISAIDLLAEWKVREQFELGKITEAVIAEHLRSNSGLIEPWRNWSADKRCGGAWFDQKQDGNYAVSANMDANARVYSDPAHACAAFIVLELRSWFR